MKGKFKRSVAYACGVLFALGVMFTPAAARQTPSGERVGTISPARAVIIKEVRHELLLLPYYGVFDWLEFEVTEDNAVILRGQVTAPPDIKGDAEAAAKDVEGVSRVVNNIEVLPVSPNDDRLRRSLYRAIYGANSPLFRYGVGSRQSIHLIVNRGRATLKGIVDNEGDRRIAVARARSVSGLFEVNDELVVEKSSRRRF